MKSIFAKHNQYYFLGCSKKCWVADYQEPANNCRDTVVIECNECNKQFLAFVLNGSSLDRSNKNFNITRA